MRLLSPPRREIVRALPFFGAGFLLVLALKYHYRHATVDDLDWILRPTAGVAELLSGIRFEREAHAGWINHPHRIILAAGCAGVNFLIVAYSTLFFSFLHRLGSAAGRGVWLAASLGIALLLTIGTNALRILGAIHLYESDLHGGLLTPERIHRAAGTVVYCLSLLLAYLTVERLFRRWGAGESGGKAASPLVPLGWYLTFTLGVPLLDRAFLADPGRFLEHATQVVSTCAFLFFGVLLWRAGRRGWPRRVDGDRADAKC
ncbi:MAG TPA: exosortase K [Candidatus Polarisedimenticolia bacterium]|jgi:exosortase K|nr:exosortase K [Candidatus Polarisedimenticolia bacterium]